MLGHLAVLDADNVGCAEFDALARGGHAGHFAAMSARENYVAGLQVSVGQMIASIVLTLISGNAVRIAFTK